MTVSKININHTANILYIQKYVISYIDTNTNITNNISVTNESGGALTPGGWVNYFIVNAFYPTNLFIAQITGSSSFSFQSLESNIVLTGYKGYTAPVFGNVTEITSGFTFSIVNVSVPDINPEAVALPVDARTAIDGESKIKLINSPLFIRENATEQTKSVTVNIYIWDGEQDRTINQPTVILKKDKVSKSDNYISLEISDIVRPFIKPRFAYNRAAAPAVTNQGVFLQAQIININFDASQTTRYTNTFFCTLGYRWNYEQNLIEDNGVQNYGASGFVIPVEKWFNPKISNYFNQTFNFTRTVEQGSTKNMVNYIAVTPTKLRCTLDPCLIVFINKLGLWESFTPHGKKTASVKVNRTVSNISHRDPSQIDNTYKHSKQITAIDAEQSYLINTGALDENMTSIVEELIYSPIVYLINFKGDLETVTTVGITIDNAVLSIDNNDITIDSQTITENALGYFKTHQQIPVVITDEDFTRKTRLNDKIAIDYNLKLAETNNKINNIR